MTTRVLAALSLLAVLVTPRLVQAQTAAGCDFDGSGVVLFPDFLAFVGFHGQEVPQEITVTTRAGTTHEMVLVAAGEFTMGSDSGDSDERPAHTVYLDAYQIDKYEVTNAQYVALLSPVGKSADDERHELLRWYYSDVPIRLCGGKFELKSPDHAAHPVVVVS